MQAKEQLRTTRGERIRPNPLIVAFLAIAAGAGANLRAGETVPPGVTDPGRSVWFQVGESNDVVMGLKYETADVLPSHRLSVEGVPAIAVYPPVQRIFMEVANWFTATNVLLNIEYYDSGTGELRVAYDSSDESFTWLPPPVPPGAWKPAADVVTCGGTLQWKTASFHLPDARFSDECNPSWNDTGTPCDHEDLFVDSSVVGGPPIRRMWITANTTDPPLPRHQIEWVDARGNVTASRTAYDDDLFVLGNAECEFTFAAAGLLKIVHKPTQAVLASNDRPYIPCRLTIHKGRTDLSVILDEMPKTVRIIGDSDPLAIEYRLGCPEMLQATLRVDELSDGLTRWKISNLSLSPYQGTTLVNVSLPDIRGLAIGGDARDDWGIIPGYASHGSGVYYDPIGGPIPAPMHLAMNWLSVYDLTNQCGIGLCLDDPNDLDTYQENDLQGGALNLRLCCNATLVTLPQAYVLAHSGDWHRVADCYRERVASRDPPPPNPAWALDLDGWDGWIANEIERGFCFIPAFYRNVVMPRGLKLLDVYRQMYDGPWSYCGVYPYPNAYYGSPEELKEAALRVHDLGGRTIYYLNYMLSTPDGSSVRRIGPASRTLIPTNVPPPFMPPGFPPITNRSYTGLNDDQFGNDRSSREWSDRDLYWATWYAQNLMADGIYFDQLSCIAGGLKETAWNLERITMEARQHVPDFITAGEGVGEAHGRFLTFGLASAVFHRTELYRYTFPAHLLMDGRANGALAWGGGDRRFNVVFLNGCRFDDLPDDETFRNSLLRLRLRTKQLLYQATFRDTDGVRIALPAEVPAPPPPSSTTAWIARYDGIQAKRFVLNTADSKLVLVNTVNTLNAGGAQATVETREAGPIHAAWAFLWDGSLQEVPFRSVADSRVAFEIHATEQATVVLVNVCEPLLEVDMPNMLPSGGQGHATVSILNLNTNAIEGVVSWELPEGWGGAPVTFGPIDPGQTGSVSAFFAAPPSAARQIHDLWCVANTGSGRARRYAPISVVATPYVQWEFAGGHSLRLTLQNLRAESVAGSVTIAFPNSAIVGTSEGEQTFSVPGFSEQVVTFHFTNLPQLREPIGILVRVLADSPGQVIPIRLYPAIANGDFETDLAGDGKPEYWTTYWDATLRETYPLINLDSSVKHGGHSSLRVDPLPAERNASVWLTPLATMLFPNTGYQITAYAKVPTNGSLEWHLPEGRTLSATGEPDADGWQLYAGVCQTGPSAYRSQLMIGNTGATPIWIDDIRTCTNSSPILESIADQSIEQGRELSLTVMATDPDVPTQTLTFSLGPETPAEARINPTNGLFSWTPTYLWETTNRITVQVTDSGFPNLTATTSFTVVVTPDQRQPRLAEVAAAAVDEGGAVSVSLQVLNEAQLGAAPLFYLNPDAPDGASIGLATGVFRWSPGEVQGPGTNWITARVVVTESPAFAAEAPYGDYAELDVAKGLTNNLIPLPGVGQDVVSGETGPPEDRRRAFRPAFEDGTPGVVSPFVVFGVLNEALGPTGCSNIHLAVAVTYYDDPTLCGARFQPDLYATVVGGEAVHTTASSSVRPEVLAGTGRWREAFFEIPDLLLERNAGVQIGPRFNFSDRIFLSRIRYRVIRPGIRSDSQTFAVIVNEVINPPVLPALTAQSVNEGDLLQFAVDGRSGEIVEGLLWEIYRGLNDTQLHSITGAFHFPHWPSQTLVLTNGLETTSSLGSDCGRRLRGYLLPPQTGDYTFWITSFGNTTSYLSSDVDPANKVPLVSVKAYVPWRQWDQEPNQRSTPIRLTVGQAYYFEVVMPESHLAMRWQLPSGQMEDPIPASRLNANLRVPVGVLTYSLAPSAPEGATINSRVFSTASG